MTFYRERGFALLFGFHFTPWLHGARHVRDTATGQESIRSGRSRWFVIYVGPWRWETEIIRHMEHHIL